MKTANRMTVAAVVMALIGAVGGQGLRASAATPAWWVETIDGIDIVQVCRVGELQVSTDYPNSTANTFRVTLQNVSNGTFGGTLQFGKTQIQKSGFTTLQKVILKAGTSRTVEITVHGLVAGEVWKLVLAIFHNGDTSAVAWAAEPLPAPENVLACNAF